MIAALHEAVFINGVKETDAVPSLHAATGDQTGRITLLGGTELWLTLSSSPPREVTPAPEVGAADD